MTAPGLGMRCEKCGDDRIVIAKQISSNGAIQVFYWCNSCRRKARRSSVFIAHKDLDMPLDDIPTLDDFGGMEACEVCGGRYTEYHHWAPRHLFEDADHWPGSYLCRNCHQKWHNIVTPEMCKHGN